MISKFILLLFSIIAFIACIGECGDVRVAVVARPGSLEFEYHAIIVGRLLKARHTVDVFVPNREYTYCLKIMPRGVCVSVDVSDFVDGRSEVHALGDRDGMQRKVDEENLSFLRGLLNLKRLRHFNPSVFIVDSGTVVGDVVAEFLGKPSIFLWPFPRRLMNGISFLDDLPRIQETFSAMRNEAGLSGGRASELFSKRHIITSGLMPIDNGIGQCPNIHKVGFLHDNNEGMANDVPVFLRQWIDKCTNGVLYVELGVEWMLDSFSTRRIFEVVTNVSSANKMCILWKGAVPMKVSEFDPMIKVVDNMVLSSGAVFQNNKVRLYLTHCLSYHILDSIRGEATVIGMYFEGKGAIGCGDIVDADIGKLASSSIDSNGLADLIMTVLQNITLQNSVRNLKRLGYLLGGTQKATETVELVAFLGRENNDFFCSVGTADVIQYRNLDMFILFSAFFVFSCVGVARLIQVLFKKTQKSKLD